MSDDLMLDLEQEIARQDGIAETAGYGYPFTRNGVRLGIAALEDELTEVRDAWRPNKNHLENCAAELREELLQVAAVAMRIARAIPAGAQGLPPGIMAQVEESRQHPERDLPRPAR